MKKKQQRQQPMVCSQSYRTAHTRMSISHDHKHGSLSLSLSFKSSTQFENGSVKSIVPYNTMLFEHIMEYTRVLCSV